MRFLLVLALVLLAVPLVWGVVDADTDLKPYVTGYWALNETGATFYDNVGSLHGTENGTVGTVASPQGAAADLDGDNNFIEFQNDPVFQFAGDFSIATSFRYSANDAGSQHLMGTGGGQGGGGSLEDATHIILRDRSSKIRNGRRKLYCGC